MFKALQHLQGIIVSLSAVVLFLVTIENIAAERWEVISQLPTRRINFSTAVVGGKVYLIGGTLFENRRGPYGLSVVEVYDPQPNTWERVADMPTARASPEIAVVAGKIYVVGGYSGVDNHLDNFKVLDIVEVYDPQTNTWERKKDMSLPRYQFGIGVVADKVYAVGGLVHPRDKKPGDPGRIDLVEVYDPVMNMWGKRAKMPTQRDNFGVGVVNNRIYAIGGSGWPQVGNGGPFLTTIEEYTPKVNRWRKRVDMPELRLSFSTVAIDNTIYLIGGFVWRNGDLKFLSTVDAYNPETEKWSDIPPISRPFIPHGASAVDGKIYVFGGRWREGIGKEGVYVATVEVFDTRFRVVTAKGKLSTLWGELKAQHQRQPQRD